MACLCTATVLTVLAAGCSSGHVAATRARTQRAEATVRHWGAYFGERSRRFDTQRSPVTVTLPGIVTQVGTSNSTQYALLTSGRLYAWGLGTHGQLGDGLRRNSFRTAVRVRFPAGVRIAFIPTDVMPYNTGLAVDTKGHVWGWGGNAGGELCLGNRKIYRRPVRLPLSHVTALAGASGHAVYDADGIVYACGLNRHGVLGDGTMRNSTTPVRVARLDGASVTQLVAGFDNAGALLSDGRYFDWGYDAEGQLGDGQVGRASDVPVRVRLPHRVRQVAQGGSIWHNGQTLVLLHDGSVWAWGDNSTGQIGNGKRGIEPLPVRVHLPRRFKYQLLATGGNTSYAVTTTGRVYAWGDSRVGQLGLGALRLTRIPLLVARGATLISSTANNVVISGPGRA
jgi:alpha-tubulin suppressor-like RCC1 family protein